MRYLDVWGSFFKTITPKVWKRTQFDEDIFQNFVANPLIAFVPCARMGHIFFSSNYVPVSLCFHHFWRDHSFRLERLSGRGWTSGPPLSSKPLRSALGRAHENRCRRGRRWAQSYPRAVGGAGHAGHGTADWGVQMISTMADFREEKRYDMILVWQVFFLEFFCVFLWGGETLFWTKNMSLRLIVGLHQFFRYPIGRSEPF